MTPCHLPLVIVASDVSSAVEGGILPPGKSVDCFTARKDFESLDSRKVLSVGLEAPLYGRQDACRYAHTRKLRIAN